MGWSYSRDGYLITGLVQGEGYEIKDLDHILILKNTDQWTSLINTQVVTFDEYSTWKHDGWVQCPKGSFLTGLFRTDPPANEPDDNLDVITAGLCQ